MYAADEEAPDQYKNQILIGPITPRYKEHSIPLNVLLASLTSGELTETQFYTDIIIAASSGYEP